MHDGVISKIFKLVVVNNLGLKGPVDEDFLLLKASFPICLGQPYIQI